MDKIPFNIVYTDGDKHLRLVMDKEELSIDEASDLSHQLSFFVQEMEQRTLLVEEGNDYADAMMAQYDDDPNPYHGDYSEE
jgi:hypothetical protein